MYPLDLVMVHIFLPKTMKCFINFPPYSSVKYKYKSTNNQDCNVFCYPGCGQHLSSPNCRSENRINIHNAFAFLCPAVMHFTDLDEQGIWFVADGCWTKEVATINCICNSTNSTSTWDGIDKLMSRATTHPPKLCVVVVQLVD